MTEIINLKQNKNVNHDTYSKSVSMRSSKILPKSQVTGDFKLLINHA